MNATGVGQIVKVALSLIVFALLWQAACYVFSVPTFLVPAPSDILLRLFEKGGLYLTHTWVTFYETLLGFAFAVLGGCLAAAVIVVVPALRDVIMPLLLIAQIVPKVAIAPILLIWFGYGLAPKVLIAFLIAFFPVVVNTTQGLISVEQELLELGQSLKATRWQIFWKFRVPTALPNLFSGMKIAITLAVIGAVIGEFVGGNRGLGYLIIIANQELDTPLAFAAILVLSVGGIILFWMIEIAERYLVPWSSTGDANIEMARQ